MTTKTDELKELIDRQPVRYLLPPVPSLMVEPGGRSIATTDADGQKVTVDLNDDLTLGMFGEVFGIAKKHLPRLPNRLIEDELTYFIETSEEERVLLELEIGDLVGASPGSQGFVLLETYAEALSALSDWTLRSADFPVGGMILEVEIPGKTEVGYEQWSVGVRMEVYVNPFKRKPSVQVILTRDEDGASIELHAEKLSLTGRAEEDVQAEVELALIRADDIAPHAREMLIGLSDVDTDAKRLIRRLATEYGLVGTISEMATSIARGDTVYDVVMAYAAQAGLPHAKGADVKKIRDMGAYMLISAGSHRCPRCLAVEDPEDDE